MFEPTWSLSAVVWSHSIEEQVRVLWPISLFPALWTSRTGLLPLSTWTPLLSALSPCMYGSFYLSTTPHCLILLALTSYLPLRLNFATSLSLPSVPASPTYSQPHMDSCANWFTLSFYLSPPSHHICKALKDQVGFSSVSLSHSVPVRHDSSLPL